MDYVLRLRPYQIAPNSWLATQQRRVWPLLHTVMNGGITPSEDAPGIMVILRGSFLDMMSR
jgi:hypothetical protein